MTTRTYEDAIAALNNLQTNFATIQQTRLTGNKNTATLRQMVEFSKRIGYNPAQYDRLNIVHVTGTKGKGSTCAFVSSILSQYKGDTIKKVGLYTSPHLRSVRERICIDGEPISEEMFAKYFFEVYEKLKLTEEDPTITTDLTKGQTPAYFKFLTLLSFYVFMKEGVDAAVMEVGIGGELDSTNIIHKPIVCGVSSIALDHTFVLGDTVEEISWNKSGIFKPGSAAFSVPQLPGSERVLKERAAEKQSSLEFVDIHPLLKDDSIKLGINGGVQKINASLAVAMTFKYLKDRGVQIYEDEPNGEVPNDVSKVKTLPKKMIEGLEKARIDGRCQILKDSQQKNLTWYIDGSHTKESINRSASWWRSIMAEKGHADSIKVLFFNQQSRSIEELLSELYNTVKDTVTLDSAVFTTNVTWSNNQYDINMVSMNVDEKKVDELEMQKRSVKQLEKLQENDTQKTQTHVFHDIESGARLVKQIAHSHPEKVVDVFVCGSLHLVGGLLVVLEKDAE